MVGPNGKCILLVLVIVGYSFCSPNASDQKRFSDSVNAKLLITQTALNELKAVDDSLNAKLVSTKTTLNELKIAFDKHMVSEGYFTSILSSQTAIFSLIVVLIFGLSSLISYTGFRREVRNTEKAIKAMESKIDKRIVTFNEATNILNRRLHWLGGITSRHSAHNEEEKGKLFSQFCSALTSAWFMDISLHYTIIESDRIYAKDIAKEMLQMAVQLLKTEKGNELFVIQFCADDSKNLTEAMRDIDDLARSEDKEIVELAAQVRTLLIELRESMQKSKDAKQSPESESDI